MKVRNVYMGMLVAGAVAALALAGAASAGDSSVKGKISAQEYEKNYDECLDGMSFICKKELLTEEDAKKIAELHAKEGAQPQAADADASKKKMIVQ